MSLARYVIDQSVNILGWLLKNRKVTNLKSNTDGRICVNLGCGLAVMPGWTNVDASLNALFAGAPGLLLKFLYQLSGANRYYHLDVYCKILIENRFIFHDLSRSLPFKPASVDYFYSSHFFEHLFQDDAIRLLCEMRLALRNNGVVRIAIPDLFYAIGLYKTGEKCKMLDDYFFVSDRSSYLARHKYMYDFELFSKLLSDAGYQNITKCAFGQGRVPNAKQLDNRPADTLFVEAFR